MDPRDMAASAVSAAKTAAATEARANSHGRALAMLGPFDSNEEAVAAAEVVGAAGLSCSVVSADWPREGGPLTLVLMPGSQEDAARIALADAGKKALFRRVD